MRLRPCSSCARHVATDAISCPFCAAVLAPAASTPITHVVGRVSRAAVFAGLSACWTSSSTSSTTPLPPPPPADAQTDQPVATDGQPVSGRVVDAATRDPLSYVTVDMRDENGRVAATKTDDNGHYQFDKVAPGNYQLVFQYSTGSEAGTWQQPIVVGDRPATVDIAMQLLRRAPTPKPYGAPPARRRTV